MRGFPQQQGLYNPENEHDACGLGVVVNIKGIRSFGIIKQALSVLVNLNHRGGNGSEKNSGDGAGILIQIPHEFLKTECSSIGISLPPPDDYGVGMVFLPSDEIQRATVEQKIIETIEGEGQTLIGFRTVPVNPVMLGKTALVSMPCIKQFFVQKNPAIQSKDEFERVLYFIRKTLEKYSQNENKYIYIPSLSSKTVVYKGMLTSEQLGEFYTDLSDPIMESALAMVHSRYSTNTFPSWERAHPYRYLMHNGEINTLRGNVNWMRAREHAIRSNLFGENLEKIFPVINPDGSDSAMFDNCLEFLTLSGRDISHAMMMMIPEPWSNHESMNVTQKSFYEYHSCIMEPWDGPAAMAFTDGISVGAVLDRNGLRPPRYYITSDDLLILASEVGVAEIPPEKIIRKERLRPGRMLLVDTIRGRIIEDQELKLRFASQYPYKEWLSKNMIELSELPIKIDKVKQPDTDIIVTRQRAFGYTLEDLRLVIAPMAKDGAEAVGSMGTDTPIAALSEKPQLLYSYSKQLFAQVTNPPIDALREEIVTATETYLGSEGNILLTIPQNCRQIKLKSPIFSNEDLSRLIDLDLPGFKSGVFPILFDANGGENCLSMALDKLFSDVDSAIRDGVNILILSDRGVDTNKAPIPALLAVSGLHHHLVRSGVRTSVGIVLESGEPKEIHDFACLIGYGVSGVNPYLAVESIVNMVREGLLPDTQEKAISNYIKACLKGVVKVVSKMGISTIQSYQGAQIFEALGISNEVIEKYFTGTPSRISGLSLNQIQEETLARHRQAFDTHQPDTQTLESGGYFQWRKNGEYHLFNPETIHKLQMAVRNGDYDLFKEYSQLLSGENQKNCTLRSLMQFKLSANPVPLEEVEPVESICRRFKTGAMSFGSISQEAHETIAVAMNRIGGKSNSGEGGESPERFIPLANGDSTCSAIKQVASGRFGVTGYYLLNANEIQIKMAQGAKPGEGGQLPGSKVYPWIAKVRHSIPGVGLISPPPHHDIYSIEDLAELIFDLKNANPKAKISVKLVSEVGVGTVAAGVAKGQADVVLISGYDGGTGASPRTSIRHAGLPWELGLAETHQTLLLNNLRNRITVEVDGKLMTGRDVAVAALLGADEFGFATAPLVSLGCVMMRVCNLDTCPVGIATQNPELRKRFTGKPEYVINFMHFVAMELREIMAQLGFRRMGEIIGRTDLLEIKLSSSNPKAQTIDLSQIFYHPDTPSAQIQKTANPTDLRPELNNILDFTELLPRCQSALLGKQRVSISLDIKNTNRATGTLLGSEVSRLYGMEGLPEDTITINFKGSAGQSLVAFIPPGITINLEGDCNDYIGKGLSGGKIAVYPHKASSFDPSTNIIVGNVAFYGATSGKAYINGVAGERFCVRNSGAIVVVEGVGDHACEYMTGGKVVVLGSTGRNFAAGMSGGVAFVFDENEEFCAKCNTAMVSLYPLEHPEDITILKNMIESHIKYTGSKKGSYLIENFSRNIGKFIKVLPNGLF